MHRFSRRSLLKGGLAALGITLLPVSRVLGAAQVEWDSASSMLNLAATIEALMCTHYHTALKSSALNFGETKAAYLTAALDAEYQHFDLLTASGGLPLVNDFYFPAQVYESPDSFTATTEAMETALIGLYVVATRHSAELGNPILAATLAQLASIEAEHLAIVRKIANLLPNHIAMLPAPFTHMYQAIDHFQPFLQGAEAFTGPVRFPGLETIRTHVVDSGLTLVVPFSARYA